MFLYNNIYWLITLGVITLSSFHCIFEKPAPMNFKFYIASTEFNKMSQKGYCTETASQPKSLFDKWYHLVNIISFPWYQSKRIRVNLFFSHSWPLNNKSNCQLIRIHMYTRKWLTSTQTAFPRNCHFFGKWCIGRLLISIKKFILHHSQHFGPFGIKLIKLTSTWRGPSWGLKHLVQINYETKSKCLSYWWVWLQKLDTIKLTEWLQKPQL